MRHVEALPRAFGDQVRLFGSVAGVVAPHGAAMANTLFLRDGAFVLELDSKNCVWGRDTRANYMAAALHDLEGGCEGRDKRHGTDEWTEWHAAPLGIRYASMPCALVRQKRRALEVDGDVAVERAVALLRAMREQRAAISCPGRA